MLIAIIPAYNEEKNIKDVVKRTIEYVDLVVVVDDGSLDGTSREAESAGAFVIKNKKNKGKAEAMRIGFSYVLQKGADFVIVLDADGQHNPDEIPLFMDEAKKGFDIVVGARKFNRRLMPFRRIFANSFSSSLTSLVTHRRILDSQSGYRLIKRNVLEKIRFTSNRYEIETEMLIKAARCGFKIGFIPIKTIYTEHAKSTVNQFIDPLRFLLLVFKLSFWRCK